MTLSEQKDRLNALPPPLIAGIAREPRLLWRYPVRDRIKLGLRRTTVALTWLRKVG